MSALSARNDITKILKLTTYLLYSEPIYIQSEPLEYKSYEYPFSKLIREYSVMPDISFCTSPDRCVYIMDTVTQKKESISYEDINSVDTGKGFKELIGSKDDLFRHLIALYTNSPSNDPFQKNIIDFFYHYQMEVGIFDTIEFNHVTYFDNHIKAEVPDKLKESLIRIAKQVVSREVNSNISGIFPAFDIDSMSHSWQINNFLSALYFSVFYIRPNVELYKECENPRCKHQKYFLISTTATNKKYCCSACANAAAQHRSRLRKMTKS